jgi:hypothetical protein
MIEPARGATPRWAAWFKSSPERVVGSAMALIAVFIVGLTGYCLCRFPTLWSWSSDGLIAALVLALIAMSYGVTGWLGSRAIERRKSPLVRLALPWGIGAGLVFGASMLGEYLIPHDNRHGMMVALGVFGTFFAILFGAGLAATKATRRVTKGALAGLWTALIASELWVFFLFSVYVSFVGTEQEARFLEVDQTIADFEKSGQTDLRAFIFGDYTGAAFFHSLLGAILGLLLGSLGGLAALAITRGHWSAPHRSDSSARQNRVAE